MNVSGKFAKNYRQPLTVIRETTLRQGRGWYVQHNGKQIPLGPDKKLAFQRFHELMSQAERAPRKARTAESFVAVCGEFLDWTQKNRAERTFRWYVERLQSFVDYLKLVDIQMAVSRVQPHHAAGWLNHHTNWSSTTRRGSIIALQRCFRWAEKMGYVDRTPMRSLDNPTMLSTTYQHLAHNPGHLLGQLRQAPTALGA